jgi:hypothetical protein
LLRWEDGDTGDAVDGFERTMAEHEAAGDGGEQHERKEDQVGGLDHLQDVVVLVHDPGHGKPDGIAFKVDHML